MKINELNNKELFNKIIDAIIAFTLLIWRLFMYLVNLIVSLIENNKPKNKGRKRIN